MTKTTRQYVFMDESGQPDVSQTGDGASSFYVIAALLLDPAEQAHGLFPGAQDFSGHGQRHGRRPELNGKGVKRPLSPFSTPDPEFNFHGNLPAGRSRPKAPLSERGRPRSPFGWLPSSPHQVGRTIRLMER